MSTSSAAATRASVLAEIELDRENEIFEHPDWVGKDVSEDPDFSNAALAGAR